MRRAGWVGSSLVAVLFVCSASYATGVGLSAGLDPTGVFLVNALTELPVSSNFDLRAEAGIASGDMAGLMLITGSVLVHEEFKSVDPFLGLGVGVALTPPPFTTGLVVEGSAGVRLAPWNVVALFGEVRYLIRWTEDGVTSGPVYEAGIEVRFG